MPEVGGKHKFPEIEAVVEEAAAVHEHLSPAGKPHQNAVSLADIHSSQGKAPFLLPFDIELEAVDGEKKGEENWDSLHQQRQFQGGFGVPPGCEPFQQEASPDQQKIEGANLRPCGRRNINRGPGQGGETINEEKGNLYEKFRQLDNPVGQWRRDRNSQDDGQANGDCHDAENRHTDKICQKGNQRKAVEVENNQRKCAQCCAQRGEEEERDPPQSAMNLLENPLPR